MLRTLALSLAVASSLDLGVDFSPVEQVIQPFLVLERTICLGLIIHKFLLGACHAILLLGCQFVQASQRMLDTLDRPDRIRRVQVC